MRILILEVIPNHLDRVFSLYNLHKYSISYLIHIGRTKDTNKIIEHCNVTASHIAWIYIQIIVNWDTQSVTKLI